MEMSTQNILLVEDDPNDIALFQRAIKKTGLTAEVSVAEDGEKAIQMLSSISESGSPERFFLPRVILLDLKMPRVSGMEVLAWIRKQPILRRLPVVIFTSSCEASDIAKAYDLGANSYLVKPVSFDQLMEITRSIYGYWILLNEKPEVQ